jgi:uncharacterized protein YjgD (DUF1641 family)
MEHTVISNQPMDELARITLAARDAMTDGMIERLVTTSANGLELLDRLNDPDTSAAIHYALDRITELHKHGGMATVFDLITLVHAAREAMTDNMLERLFMFGSDGIGALAMNAQEALCEAAEETAKDKPSGGVLPLIALMRKPETQQTLAFLLAFANKLQSRTMGT